jgi:phosphatidylserine/phosphatidylglycerophosphate/cardiolipin synthase-like enzyme
MPSDPLGKVKAYFSPGRDALEVTVGFIDRTARTLDVAIFSITHPDIVAALVRAHKRGVSGGDGGPIRVLTDKDQAAGAAQMAAVKALADAGLAVRVDRESGYAHNKYAVSDARGRTPAALCGSYNWSVRATTRNRESLARIRVKACVRQFADDFGRIWAASAP